ncbi:MAG: hypothetical protein VB055_10530 [Oscillospiraceae bacterium]|nr:hypothetical protein [Oscillospiraceae bacterium]
MDFLKRYFPFSYRPVDTRAFVITLLIYVVIGAVVGTLIALFSHLWLVGWIFKILGSLFDLYILVGIIVTILSFVGVIK